MNPMDLTIHDAQRKQPWTVPYSSQFGYARIGLGHLDSTHAVLHAQKSLGKLAAAFEAADHAQFPEVLLDGEQAQVIRDMAADLMTVALRLANLHNFDLAAELIRRVEEKNGKTY